MKHKFCGRFGYLHKQATTDYDHICRIIKRQISSLVLRNFLFWGKLVNYGTRSDVLSTCFMRRIILWVILGRYVYRPKRRTVGLVNDE
jgi:hypothetical protein